MTADSKVIVIVDPDYGDRLLALAEGVPVWIFDTPVNRAAAEQCWLRNPHEPHLSGVTTFRVAAGTMPEEAFLNEMAVIDLHHGEYSSTDPYTVLEVMGAALSARIKEELSNYYFEQFAETDNGFVAVRKRTAPG